MFVPKDLQPYIGRKELRYSLRTGYLGVAKHKARLIAGQVQLIFKFLRRGNKALEKLSDTQIQEIVQKYLKSYINSIEERMYSDELLPFAIDAQSFYEYINELDFIKQDITEYLGIRDYSTVENIVNDLLKDNGIDNIDKSSVSYQKLCRGILRAQLNGIDEEKKQMLGDSSDNINIDPSISLQQTSKNSDSEFLSKVVEKYVSEARIKWKEKTESTHMSTLNLFKEIVGDVPIQTITRKKVGEFKAVLMKLPPNMRKVKKYRDKTIPQILKMDVEKTLATLTINDHLQRVCSMFEYACINGLYVGPNPATKMQLPVETSSGERRAPFTLDELNKLFRSEQYLEDTFKHPYQFWTPIIALFHGMRQNEIAQLYLSDIKRSEDGVWIFDVSENADDKSIKTKSSKRLVPIHPFILNELNFITYYERLKSEGKQRLFPEISRQRDGYGQTVSEWFNERYKKKCGIADVDGRKKDYHSFRKTFATDIYHKKLPRDLRLRIVGHSIGNDESSKTYNDDFPSQQFYDEIISKVDFEKQIDLTHLKQSKYVIKD
jgi:integrase